MDILESCLVKKCAKIGCAKPTNIYLLDFINTLSNMYLLDLSIYLYDKPQKTPIKIFYTTENQERCFIQY